MLKKPMTTEEPSDRIKGILREKDKMPDIPDYGPGAFRPVQVETYESDLKSSHAYGAARGRTTPGAGSAQTEAETCLNLWMFICLMNRETG